MANELDFGGKQVLVVGGSSGIGNGIAQAFRARGARVAVCGTRAQPEEYSAEEGSDLAGLACLTCLRIDASLVHLITRNKRREETACPNSSSSAGP